MDDFDAPSFSLGFDDNELPASNPQSEPTADCISPPDSNPRYAVVQDQAIEDLQCRDKESLPSLKRLRRGPPPAREDRQTTRQGFEFNETPIDVDVIEDSSSEDKETPPPGNPSVRSTSSSKLSMHGRGFLSTVSHSLKKSTPSIAGTESPPNLEGSSDRKPAWVQKMDPLRKLRLLNDEFDDDFVEEEEWCARVGNGRVTRDGGGTEARGKPSAKPVFGSQKIVEGAKGFQRKPPQDLWKYFNVIESRSLPSPAFDEFCDEYFSSPKVNIRNTAVSNGEIGSPIGNSVPCVCQYFDSDDINIQRLLRQRLPHFVPVNSVMRADDQSSERVYVDYLGQFGGCGVTNAARNQPCGVNFSSQARSFTKEKSTARSAGKRKKGVQVGTDTGNWTIPGNQNIDSIPRDAGKRRVCAQGRSTGHWFTDQTGTKVYVTKDGQQMTGRSAYMEHKKESGKRFRKTNKKFKKIAGKKKRKGRG